MQATEQPRVNLTMPADKSFAFTALGCFAKSQSKINVPFPGTGTDICPTISLFNLKQAEGCNSPTLFINNFQELEQTSAYTIIFPVLYKQMHLNPF